MLKQICLELRRCAIFYPLASHVVNSSREVFMIIQLAHEQQVASSIHV
jgi:hypothetical protein